jgi:hypothetical protein
VGGSVCLFISHTAATVVYKNNSSSQLISQGESDQKGFSFEFNLPQVDAQRGTITEFGEGTNLLIPDEQAIGSPPGLPDVSIIQLLIRIPDQGNVAVETQDVQSKPLGSYAVLPVQKPQLINGYVFPFEMNQSVYNANAFFPAANAVVKSYEILGDIRIARVILYPIKVNPVTNETQIITSMKVRVNYTGGKGEDELNIVDKGLTRSFIPFYKDVLNFDAAIFPKFSDRAEPGCYVFIGNEASLAAVEDLSNWKLRKGYDVKIQDISSIGSSASALDAWIEDAYNNWPNKPEFILLCGDADIVPTATKNNCESDNGFGVIGGSGWVPSVHVGRITPKNGEMQSLTYQAWKVRIYEMDPVDGDWTLTARTWGSRSPDGIAPNRRIATMYEGKGFTVTQDIEGQSPKTGTALVDELSKGLSVMSYIAHGSSTSWSSARVSTSQIGEIKNGRMLPWIWNIACQNSAFEGRLCYAEAFMCAGTIDDPGGLLGMISFAPNASTAAIPMFEKGQEEYFINDEMWHIGACVNWAKQHITYSESDKWGGIIWGCPEVDLFLTSSPLATIEADHPHVKPGPFTLNATGDGGALEGALVGVATTKYQYLASGFTDASGDVSLTIPNFQADSVFVTVTYHNHRPYLGVFKAGGVFNVITPRHGDIFDVGEDIAITWKTEEGPVDKVNIEFSEDAGQTFSPIATSIDNTESYPWKAPNVGSEQCVIRISDAASPSRNSASGLFTIYDVSTLTGTVSGMVPANVHYVGPKTGDVPSDNQGAYTMKLFPGTFSVFAQADIYFSDTVEVTVPPDVSGVDLEVKFPKIALSSTKVTSVVKPDASVNKELEITNAGKRPLEFSVYNLANEPIIKINEVYASVDAFYDGLELWNQGPDLDLTGWKVEWKDNQNTSGEYTFPSGVTFRGGRTIILMDTDGSQNDSTIFYCGGNMYWDVGQTELSIAVLDNNGSGVDFVKTSGNNDNPPQGTSWSGSGVSLSNDILYRKNNEDNDNQDDWAAEKEASFNFLNPGQTNCIFPKWMTPSAVEGIVASTSSNKLTYSFDATGFSSGTVLTDKMWIHHNAPQQASPMEVACTLYVNNVGIIVDNDPDLKGVVNFVAMPNPVDLRQNSEVVLIYNTNVKIVKVKLMIFDQLGNTVDKSSEVGNKYTWDLTNKSGRKVAGGTYLAVLQLVDDKGNAIVRKTMIGVKK